MGKRSTGKGQNDGKRYAKQEKKNSKTDERPSQRDRWKLLSRISWWTVR